MLRDNVCDTMGKGDGGITLNAMIECVYNTEDQGDGWIKLNAIIESVCVISWAREMT